MSLPRGVLPLEGWKCLTAALVIPAVRGVDDSGVPPHAFDPWMQPELFRGVLTRRIFAFLIDLIVLSVPVILACIFIAIFGVITLGLGWALFWLVSPASVIWALV